MRAEYGSLDNVSTPGARFSSSWSLVSGDASASKRRTEQSRIFSSIWAMDGRSRTACCVRLAPPRLDTPPLLANSALRRWVAANYGRNTLLSPSSEGTGPHHILCRSRHPPCGGGFVPRVYLSFVDGNDLPIGRSRFQ